VLFDGVRHDYHRFNSEQSASPGGWLTWARHLAHRLAEARGWPKAVRQDVDRALAMLLSATWLGTAVLVRAPDPDTARAILTPDRYADIEVHNWQFGGRPS
jgi:hypothetical protein